MNPKYLSTTAVISPCTRYRYALGRQLAPGARTILFVGLNPSTADATQDDPTIRREVDYARRWGFDWYQKANLYGWRSTDPKVLGRLDDATAMGPDNWETVRQLVDRAELVVCAWGGARLHPSATALAAALRALPSARYLHLNGDGSPAHPLYLKKSLTLQAFR